MKKIYSRPRRIVKRLVILLLTLMVLNGLGLYRVTPWRGVRAIADLCDVEKPEKITRFYDATLPIHRFALKYLVDGENAMMLCTTAFHPLMGWYDRDYCRVETWDGAPIHAGLASHSQGEKEVMYLFGRVDNGYITEFTLEYNKLVEGKDGGIQRIPCSVEVPASAIFWGENEKRYFLTPMQLPEDADARYYPQLQDFRIIGYDHTGKVLADEEVFRQHWSTSAN